MSTGLLFDESLTGFNWEDGNVYKNENEEREFWENNDTLDYFDESKVKVNSMDVLQEGFVGKRV